MPLSTQIIEPVNIPILYQDDSIILVNKPAGIPSQPTVDKKRIDLYTLLNRQLGFSVYQHHRLDKDTSGVILFATSKKANLPLTEMFKKHQFKKTYICLTKPQKNLDQNLDEKSKQIRELHSQWTITNHLVARRKFGQGPKSVKMFRTDSGGDYAETHFKILSVSEHSNLVEASPLTGRTHQIRVHCLHSGIPILGDSLYGGKDASVPRLMLHAFSLEFAHPLSGKVLKISAPLPEDFSTLLKKWHPQLEANVEAPSSDS